MTKEEFFRRLHATKKCRWDEWRSKTQELLSLANVTVQFVSTENLGRCYTRTTHRVELPWRLSPAGEKFLLDSGLVGSGQSHTIREELGAGVDRYSYQVVATCDSSD